MISIVVYGRNDSYGYNLHKRAAISFNCMAEMLTDRDDEIIFVDYNTPNDFPTFPEAILDTLTKHARSKLRVLRVRPEVHARFKDKTHLVALEPISRNIAVRRSNPNNRWILSTNTDIVFVPQKWTNLTRYARNLAPGFYHAPRLEIPEALWESLDRKDPARIIKTVKKWGRQFHLDEIVYANDVVKYDGPGDFQLMERDILFKVGGFHEEMLIGWHVDSNIAARLKLYYGKVSDAGQDFYAYHCDHTRQITPMHGHNKKENSIQHFVDEVTSPYVPEQAETWGCPDAYIEDYRFDGTNEKYLTALGSAIGAPLEKPYQARYASEAYDKVEYDPRHVLPFLIDIFSAAPRSMKVAWLGRRTQTLEMFAKLWTSLGFTSPVMIQPDTKNTPAPVGTRIEPDAQLFEEAESFIFEFDGRANPAERKTEIDARRIALSPFLKAVTSEHERMRADQPPTRRFIGLNAIHNSFEGIFKAYVGASATPFSSRIRHGFALPPQNGEVDWLPLMKVGSGGRSIDGGFEAIPGSDDWVCFGPYKSMQRGRYRLRVGFEFSQTQPGEATPQIGACVQVAATAGNFVVDMGLVPSSLRPDEDFSLEFDVPELLELDALASFEVRIKAMSGCLFRVRRLSVERTAVKPQDNRLKSFGTKATNIIPYMTLSSEGRREGDEIVSTIGKDGHLAHGPSWAFPRGRYEALFDLFVEPPPKMPEGSEERSKFAVEVVQSGEFLVHETRESDELNGAVTIAGSFEIRERVLAPLEFRIWTSGHSQICLRGVRVIDSQ